MEIQHKRLLLILDNERKKVQIIIIKKKQFIVQILCIKMGRYKVIPMLMFLTLI